MTTPIIQQLGVDATQALQAIDQFDQRLKVLDKTIANLGQTMANWNRQANQAVNQVATSTQNNLKPATESVNKFGLSLATLGRVVQTQLVVSVLQRIKAAAADAAETAIEFQRQISLIETIAGGAGFDEIAQGVRQISDNFNIPLLEAAAGVYQTISNQVGTLAESLEFAETAARFARSTNSTLADSVDLLSGALKSYNLETSDAERVASIFFTVIDKGRVTASELGNSLGRIAPQAASLGVDLEELGGALAAISVRGSNSAESITQLRAILSAIQKPTKEMQKALRDMGFTSAQSALQTLGFAETIRGLERSTGGSAEELAKLFRNVRGLSGVTSITSDELKNLSDNIEAMKNQSRDFAKEKFLIATANQAEEATKAINKLRNALALGIGQGFVSITSGILQLTGGVDNLIAAGPALVGIGSTFLTLASATAAFNKQLTFTTRLLGGIAALPLAATAGTALGQAINSFSESSRVRNLNPIREQNKKELEEFEKLQGQKRDAEKKLQDDRLDSARKTIQSLNVTYLQDVENAKRASQILTDNAQTAVNRIIKAREQYIQELTRVVTDSEKIVLDSQQRILSATERQSDREFDFRNQGDSATQVSRLLQRAQEFSSRGIQLLQSGDVKQIDEAVRLLEKAQGLGEKAFGAAGDDRSLQARALQQLGALTNQQVDAERELQRIQQDRAALAEEERQRQEQILDTIKSQAKILIENTGVFDAEGNRFNDVDLEKRAKARADAAKKLAETAFSSGDLSISQALGLTDFVSRTQQELARDPIQLAFDIENQTAQIQDTLTQAFSKFRLKLNFDVVGLEQLVGAANNPDQVGQQLGKANEEATKLRAQIDQLQAKKFQIPGLQEELGALATQLQSPTIGISGGSATQNAIVAQFKTLGAEVAAIGQAGTVSSDQLNSVITKARELGQLITTAGSTNVETFVNTVQFQDDFRTIGEAIQVIRQLQSATAVDPQISGLQQRLGALDMILNSIQQKSPATELANSTVAISNGVLPSAAIAANYRQIANDAERTQRAVNSTGTPGVPTGRQFGGMMHLASGGFARGTDVIPAMLTRGESVINADSTRKFFSQIQAINAGVKPLFRSEGGSVTNIGDINVSVRGAETTSATARQIALELRRELRRGSSRL